VGSVGEIGGKVGIGRLGKWRNGGEYCKIIRVGGIGRTQTQKLRMGGGGRSWFWKKMDWVKEDLKGWEKVIVGRGKKFT
jgi:hypothetical protein